MGIEWIYTNKELPPLDKSYRCLAKISVDKEFCNWDGYADVYFTSTNGWRKCETEEMVTVIKWILIENLEKE